MLRYIIKPILCIVWAAMIPHYVGAKDRLSSNRIWPTTCYLGVDLAKTCVGWYQKTGDIYEIHGSIGWSPILLDGDYGWGEIQRDGRQDNGSFASAGGKYFRIGLGYNFLRPTLHHNQFFIGMRYARSFFDFQLKSNKLQCNHPSDKACKAQVCTAPPVCLQHSKGSQRAHWWEIVGGGKVQLVTMLSIGCTARYKFSKKLENNLYALPFDIPGFGLAAFDHAFGWSFYLLLRIPLQKSNKTYHEYFSQKSVT